jgi:hypothetical protein
MAAPHAPTNARSRAPITAMRRPRPSMWQSHTFGSASLPGGAGIPGPNARGHAENRGMAEDR